jgi:UDP-N-acetylmuramate: L-alanyl-gamma-D-glutamyl-meso-diaminopimelate ligase
MKNVHFIAVGGSVMHNLAIALHKKGYQVTGSDDQIFEPSASRLQYYNLLPEQMGWDPQKIHKQLDAVILGMHAKIDNPELQKARELGIKIFSFPEFLYEQTKDKKRIVIGGSHGKTTITSMIMHVLKQNNIHFDYMVGAQIEGFETMVGLKNDTDIAIFEGDEYLSSPIDQRPKFHLYKGHIGVISGIAWDHINVFPTYEKYKEQFKIFAESIIPNGTLIYNETDPEIGDILPRRKDLNFIPYTQHPSKVIEGKTHLINNSKEIPIKIFGQHNMANIEAAKKVCTAIGIDEEKFYDSIKYFTGAAKRLQLLEETGNTKIFLDFAHAPSKLKATIDAVKQQYPKRELIACMELHSFSSLNKKFLSQYKNSMSSADKPIIYANPETIRHKELEMLNKKDIKEAFNSGKLEVYFDKDELLNKIKQIPLENKNILFMTSGNFDGVNFKLLAEELSGKN